MIGKSGFIERPAALRSAVQASLMISALRLLATAVAATSLKLKSDLMLLTGLK